jgi:hypothetical protein
MIWAINEEVRFLHLGGTKTGLLGYVFVHSRSGAKGLNC